MNEAGVADFTALRSAELEGTIAPVFKPGFKIPNAAGINSKIRVTLRPHTRLTISLHIRER